MKITAELKLDEKYFVVILLEDGDLAFVQDDAMRGRILAINSFRLASGTELVILHQALKNSGEGEVSKLEHTVAIGDKHAGKYTFVGGGIFEYTLTGIKKEEIRKGHKILVVRI